MQNVHNSYILSPFEAALIVVKSTENLVESLLALAQGKSL
jgi:hypothetical protein